MVLPRICVIIKVMSEVRTPHEQLADTLTSAISPGWEEFDQLASLPSVQNFCQYDSRYSNMGRTVTQEEAETSYDVAFMKRNTQVEQASTDEVAECLERTNQRLDEFLRTLTAELCGRRNKPVPEDEAGQMMVLNRILSGGLERVRDSISRVSRSGEVDGAYYYLQSSFLPVSFVMLGARLKAAKHYEEVGAGLEAASTQVEIDEDIDTTLQAACLGIQRNEKLVVDKNATDADRLFAASMNCLRSLYYGQRDSSFKSQVLTFYGATFFSCDLETSELRHAARMNDPDALTALTAKAYRSVAAHFNDMLGTDFPAMDDSSAARALQRSAHRGYESEQKGTYGFDIADTESRISAIHSAHQFVDGIASGAIKYSDVMKSMMKLREQPLEPTYYDKLVDLVEDKWVEWEILPASLREDTERNPSPDGIPRAPIDHEEWVDWKRVWRLQNYAKGWTGAYYVRTKIPNLPLEDQYYAVILPESHNGEIRESAVADHPKAKHGLYAWRPEMGIDSGRNGVTERVRLTWREVMSQPRMVARQLGARCLYHTDTLETNLLDYMTAEPEKVVRRYYSKRTSK